MYSACTELVRCNFRILYSVSCLLCASTGQKTAGAALTATAAATKTVKFPTTIGDNAGIDDNGTAVTEFTQDQANKINRI